MNTGKNSTMRKKKRKKRGPKELLTKVKGVEEEWGRRISKREILIRLTVSYLISRLHLTWH